ncbi:hypothetical protein AYO45_06255 [Gammaproteobacteria bacterium SCGC AG-212-F23]|nr:hypothetical protein AYO45_06255 [Gammaproteobacteria bacterium SCGC AG-212-F23]
MKKYLLFAMLAGLSVNSFAWNITHGQVLNHKIWTTGNASYVLKDVHQTKNIVQARATDDQTTPMDHQTLFVMADLSAATATQGVPVSLYGDHSVYVYNSDSVPHSYPYQYGMCVEVSEHQLDCVYIQDQVMLDAGGEASLTKMPVLKTQFNQAGTHPVYLMVTLGDHMAVSNSYVTVS